MYTFDKEEVLKDWEMQLVYEAAFEDGQFEAQKKMATKMLESGIAIETIAKAIGLTVEEIEILKMRRNENETVFKFP